MYSKRICYYCKFKSSSSRSTSTSTSTPTSTLKSTIHRKHFLLQRLLSLSSVSCENNITRGTSTSTSTGTGTNTNTSNNACTQIHSNQVLNRRKQKNTGAFEFSTISSFSLKNGTCSITRTNHNHINNIGSSSSSSISAPYEYVHYFHSTASCHHSDSSSTRTSSSNNKPQKEEQKTHQTSTQNPTSASASTPVPTPVPMPISIIQNMDLLNEIPLEDVRNFCFIAHVDHGKSSLASRVLELTGNLGLEQQMTAIEHATKNDNIDNVNDNGVEEDYDYNRGSSDDLIAAISTTSSSNSNSSAGSSLISDVDENTINIDESNVNDTVNGDNLTKVNNTNTSSNNNNNNNTAKEQIELLDTLAVEKERGITVKASAASMLYPHPSAKGKHGVLLLNMVDTPGHVDFSTEVTRTLSSVQGAVLLFDSAQGVQAQTLSVHERARGMSNIGVVLPVLTKVDLPSSRALDVALSVSELFGFDPDEVLPTSARSRKGIAEVLEAVCCNVPPPKQLPDDDGEVLRAQVVDSWFEPLRGVVCLVQILSGELNESNRVSILEPSIKKSNDTPGSNDTQRYTGRIKDHYSIQDVGLVLPHRIRTGKLTRGQMGYVIVGLRDPRQARPGTVMVLHKDFSKVMDMALPEIHTTSSSQSVLYASVHPLEGEGFDDLSNAIDRLALNDTGLEIQRTSGASNSDGSGGPYLGPGLRVGFQGLLHVEVFQQRLFDEFGLEAVVTPPKVPYRITYLGSKSTHNQRPSDAPTTEIIEDLSKWPGQGIRFKVEEPVVDIRIMSPMEYAGNIMDLIKRKRGTGMETKPIDELTWLFKAQVPWGEVVTDFHDELKNVSAGYASFDSRESNPPFVEANLSKVDIMLNGDVVEPLAFVCHKDNAQAHGRVVCKKLQEVLPRQQFVTIIQAKADSKIIASERIRSYRKDVLTTGGSKSVGGGDITRKKKLLEKQKKGKKRQQASGKVTLSQAAFNSVISRSS